MRHIISLRMMKLERYFCPPAARSRHTFHSHGFTFFFILLTTLSIPHNLQYSYLRWVSRLTEYFINRDVIPPRAPDTLTSAEYRESREKSLLYDFLRSAIVNKPFSLLPTLALLLVFCTGSGVGKKKIRPRVDFVGLTVYLLYCTIVR